MRTETDIVRLFAPTVSEFGNGTQSDAAIPAIKHGTGASPRGRFLHSGSNIFGMLRKKSFGSYTVFIDNGQQEKHLHVH